MSHVGQSRYFDRAPLTSGLPRLTDILTVNRHVSNVPFTGHKPSLDHPVARMRREDGMVRPRALAVLGLTKISYRSGCSTGRSAGFAPRTIFVDVSRALPAHCNDIRPEAN